MSRSLDIGLGITISAVTAGALLWLISEFDSRDARHADRIDEETKHVVANQKINSDRLKWVNWTLGEYKKIPDPDPDELARIDALRNERDALQAANELYARELIQLRAERRQK